MCHIGRMPRVRGFFSTFAISAGGIIAIMPVFLWEAWHFVARVFTIARAQLATAGTDATHHVVHHVVEHVAVQRPGRQGLLARTRPRGLRDSDSTLLRGPS